MSTLTKEPTVVLNGDNGDNGDTGVTGVTGADAPIKITRGRIDHLLVWSGGAIAVVLVVAGALLTWGSNFSEDYVHDELAAQAITFPPAAALEEEGREDLVKYADQQVDSRRRGRGLRQLHRRPRRGHRRWRHLRRAR